MSRRIENAFLFATSIWLIGVIWLIARVDKRGTEPISKESKNPILEVMWFNEENKRWNPKDKGFYIFCKGQYYELGVVKGDQEGIGNIVCKLAEQDISKVKKVEISSTSEEDLKKIEKSVKTPKATKK